MTLFIFHFWSFLFGAIFVLLVFFGLAAMVKQSDVDFEEENQQDEWINNKNDLT